MEGGEGGERRRGAASRGDGEEVAGLWRGNAVARGQGGQRQLYGNGRRVGQVSARLRYMAHDAVQRPDGTYAYRVRATLDAPTDHRVGLKGTAKLQGEHVPAIWWVMRRPVATLRSTLGL